MCCQKSIGVQNSYPSQASAKSAKRVAARGMLWLFNILVCVALTNCRSAPHTTPWFGRGQNLPRAPITILTGPIDLDRGIQGVLELDMKRDQVEANLGEPLVPEMPSEVALDQGLDPEDVGDNLYSGVFAWVQYNYKDEVISIEFLPRALEERMGLKQELFVRFGGQTLKLSSRTHRRDVEDFWKRLRVKQVHDFGHYVVLDFGKHSCSIDFDRDGYFESLSL